jgi:hypothetical protein
MIVLAMLEAQLFSTRSGSIRSRSGLRVLGPDVIAGEADVFPAERRNMTQHCGRRAGRRTRR